MKNKKFYAIKVGNNVKNLIVDSWEECAKYVIGYPSVYKGFKNKDTARNYLESIPEEIVQEQLMWGEIYRFNRLKGKLQREYGFIIPDDIIDEIINNDDYDNLCYLLNIAVLNKKISKKNARIIKEKELKKISAKKKKM